MPNFWKAEKRKTPFAQAISTLLFCALFATGFSDTAHADVGLVVKLTKDNPVHRDYLTGVINDAYARWQMLPAFPAEAVEKNCGKRDEFCSAFAKKMGATHVVFLSTAELGASDFVVLIKVIDVKRNKELLTYSDLATPGKAPRFEGMKVAQAQFSKVKGLPTKANVKVDPSVDEVSIVKKNVVVPYSGLGPLSLAGWSVAGLGAATAVVGGVWAGALAAAPDSPGNIQKSRDLSATFFPASAVAVVGGLSLVIVDALVHKKRASSAGE